LKQYGTETVSYILSGDLEYSEESTGDKWIGTGTVIGVDASGKIRIIGSYENGIKNGLFIHISDGAKVSESVIEWNHWIQGKLISSRSHGLGKAKE